MLALFVITRFAQFGSNLIAPLTGIMWAFGALCALLLPSQRVSTLTETNVTIACYLLSMAGIRELIALVSGVSSEMLMASYNQAIPLTSGSTISGYLHPNRNFSSRQEDFGIPDVLIPNKCRYIRWVERRDAR